MKEFTIKLTKEDNGETSVEVDSVELIREVIIKGQFGQELDEFEYTVAKLMATLKKCEDKECINVDS
jgi:hypothetical protein